MSRTQDTCRLKRAQEGRESRAGPSRAGFSQLLFPPWLCYSDSLFCLFTDTRNLSCRAWMTLGGMDGALRLQRSDVPEHVLRVAPERLVAHVGGLVIGDGTSTSEVY